MLDPVTALAAASTAFNVIKKGFEIGRDVESMYTDIGRWMSAVSDIEKAHQDSKNPPLFKKIGFSKSVEEEAMATWQAKIKAQEMRDELRSIISFMRGPAAWDELLRMEAQIRKERQEIIYNQREKRKRFVEYTLAAVLTLIGSSIVIWFFWFLISYSNP